MDDPAVDPRAVRTYPLAARPTKVALGAFARPPRAGATLREVVDALPSLGGGEVFREIVRAIVRARRAGKAIAWGLGAHVVKTGLSPVIVGLMKEGFVTSVALNGGGSIHDFEIALVGRTSEDVGAGLGDGSFGMVEETGRLMNEALGAVMSPGNEGEGAGSLLARRLVELGAPNVADSLLATGHRLGIPVTCHVTIGADTTHMHPAVDGAALGRAALNDFHAFVRALGTLGGGGVYLNVGSAVTLPEVFLKALTILRNVRDDVFDFTTVNLDMQRHYRPTENVLRRPTQERGNALEMIGLHEVQLPLLAHAVLDGWQQEEGRGAEASGG